MPKAKALDLQTGVSSSYASTHTTTAGNASQKTVSSKLAVGTPLISFADIISDANITPLHTEYTTNGRVFVFNAPAAGVGTIALYNLSITTGSWVYVGKLAYTVPNSPATTHTLRAPKVVDTGTTSWKIIVNTVGTVTANGGLFISLNVALSDFVPVGFATLPQASAPAQKAVYWAQETGGTNLLIASQGMDTDFEFGGTKIYIGHNTAATFQGYIFDHALTITTVGGSGVTSDLFVLKTGTLPGVVATILLLNNFTVCTPTAASGVPVALQGQLCIHFPSSATFHMGLLSEWTSGVTSWPSLSTCNNSSTASSEVAVTTLTAHFSQTLQRIVFQHSTGRYVVKTFTNNYWEFSFGNPSDTQLRTAVSVPFYEWGSFTAVGIMTRNGWLLQCSSTAGQIGCLAFNLQSAYQFDTNYIVSKVIDIPLSSQVLTIRFTAPIRSFAQVYYRTSGFGTITGGWVAGPLDGDYSGISFVGVSQIQFKLMPRFERDGATVPLQFYEGYVVYKPLNEISDNWEGSVDNTTDSTQTPAYTAFRMIKSTSGKYYFRAYDDSGTLVASANTEDNFAFFDNTTNNGTSWTPFASANDYSSTVLTTEIRYKWASPPGVKVTCSLSET